MAERSRRGIGVAEAITDLSDEALIAAVERHDRENDVRWTTLQGGYLDDRPELVRYVVGEPVSYTNGAAGGRIPEREAEDWVRETAELFREHRVPAIWWTGPLTRPIGLGAILERHGFHHEEDMPWLAADLAAVDLEPAAPAGLVAARVRDSAAQAEWLEVMATGFGMDLPERSSIARLADAVGLAEDAPWWRFLGVVDGRPVASAGVMFSGGVAGLYNVTTVPDARRRGYGEAMTRVALRAAREAGYRVAILGSSEMARPLYERMGFRGVCSLSLYLWPGPDAVTG